MFDMRSVPLKTLVKEFDLEIAYAGFDNAIEEDLIDSYIFEINALQKRYNHLRKKKKCSHTP